MDDKIYIERKISFVLVLLRNINNSIEHLSPNTELAFDCVFFRFQTALYLLCLYVKLSSKKDTLRVRI